VTHRLQNIGNGLFRAIVVINETPGDDTTSEQAAGFTAKPELNNAWFRAYRIGLSPGERSAAHQHRAPVAVIQQTAGRGAGAGATTWEFNQPGQWAFFDAGDPHAFMNVGETRLELIEVELRTK
jgi:quercetin dioxygenase-like cupin family protein